MLDSPSNSSNTIIIIIIIRYNFWHIYTMGNLQLEDA